MGLRNTLHSKESDKKKDTEYTDVTRSLASDLMAIGESHSAPEASAIGNRAVARQADPTVQEKAPMFSKDAFKPDAQEGYIETVFVKLFSKLNSVIQKKAGGESDVTEQMDTYKMGARKSAEDLKTTNYSDVRQTKISPYLRTQLFIDNASRDLGGFRADVAEDITRSVELGGYDVTGTKDLAARAFGNFQQVLDSVLPAEVSGGIARRIFQGSNFEMPVDFQFSSDVEYSLKEALATANQAGRTVPLTQFGSNVKIHPGMDEDTARELLYNDYVVRARNQATYVSTDGQLQDVSAAVQMLASFGMSAGATGASAAAKGGAAGLSASQALSRGLLPNTFSAITQNPLNNLFRKPMANLPGWTKVIGNYGADIAAGAVYTGALSAIASPGDAMQMGLGGAVVGGLFPTITGLPRAIGDGFFKPIVTATVQPTAQQAQQLSQVVNRQTNTMTVPAGVAGSTQPTKITAETLNDPAVFTYVVENLPKNPEVRKLLRTIHDATHPNMTINEVRNREAIAALDQDRHWTKLTELQANPNRTKAEESLLQKLIQDRAGVKQAQNRLIKHSHLSDQDLIKVALTDPSTHGLVGPLRQLLNSSVHSEDAYLQRLLIDTLSNPHFTFKDPTKKYWETGEALQLTDPISLGIQNVLRTTKSGGLVSMETKFIHHQNQHIKYSQQLLQDLQFELSTQLPLAQVQTIMKRVEQQGVVLLPKTIKDAKILEAAKKTNTNLTNLRAANRELVSEYETLINMMSTKSLQPKDIVKAAPIDGIGLVRNLDTVLDTLDFGQTAKQKNVSGALATLTQLRDTLKDPFAVTPQMLDAIDLKSLTLVSRNISAEIQSRYKSVKAMRNSPAKIAALQQLDLQTASMQSTLRFLGQVAADVPRFKKDIELIRVNDLANATTLHAKLRALATISSETQSRWGKREAYRQKELYRQTLINDIQTETHLNRDSAEMLYLWQTKDMHGFFVNIKKQVDSGKAPDAAILHMFTRLDNSYGALAHKLLDTISEQLDAKVGVKVSKEFLQGFFVRADNPIALMKLLEKTTLTDAERKVFLDSARNSAKGRASATNPIGFVGHSITVERAMESQTGMSMGGVLGNLQRDSIIGGQDVSDFQRLAPIKELMDRLRNVGGNEDLHKLTLLIDGVEGVQTILVKNDEVKIPRSQMVADPHQWVAEAKSKTGYTSTGKILDELLDTPEWAAVANSRSGMADDVKATKDLAAVIEKVVNGLDQPSYDALVKQLAAEGGMARLGKLPVNKTDAGYQEAVSRFAREYSMWAGDYFSPAFAIDPNNSGKLIREAVQAYSDFKTFDTLVSGWSRTGAEESSASYGYPLRAPQHRAHRTLGKIKDELEFNKRLQMGERASGLGRYFGTSSNSQLAAAGGRSIRDSENLYTGVIRDGLLRITGARTQHALDQAQAYLQRIDNLGFKTQAAELNKLLGANQMKMYMDNLTTQLNKFTFRAGRAGRFAQYLNEFAGALGQMSGYLGRFTKPFIEAVQMTEMLLINSNMYRTTPGRKAMFIGMSAPFVNFFRQFGFMVKPMPKDGFLGMGVAKAGGSAMDAKLVELENTLVKEYMQKVDVAFTKRLINKSLAGENALKPGTKFEKGMDKWYDFNNMIFTRTKELQETLGNRTGARLGRTFFEHMAGEIESGATLHQVYQTLKSSMQLNTSEARLLQATATLFDGIAPGAGAKDAILAKLTTPQGGKAYRDFCAMFIENSIGRYGALSGSTASRWVSQINPSLGLYFTPATLFVDRYVTSKVAAIYGSQTPLATAVKTMLKNTILPTVALYTWYLGKGLLEGGTEETHLPLMGESVNDFFHYELEQNPTLRRWVTNGAPLMEKFDRQGFGKATSVMPGFGYELLTKKEGTGRAWADLKKYPAKVMTGTTGTERGLGTIAGFDVALGLGIMADAVSMANQQVRVRGAIEKLADETLAQRLTPDEYRRKVADLYSVVISNVKNPTLKEKAKEAIKTNGMVTAEMLDAIDRDIELQVYSTITGALDKSPIAGLAHAINPVVLVHSFRAMVRSDVEQIESAHWLDTLQGVEKGGRQKQYTSFEKFVGAVFEGYIAAGAVTEKDVERYMNIAKQMGQLHYGADWDNPNLGTPVVVR